MARTKPATAEAVTPETPADVPVSPADMVEALQNEFAKREQPKRITISELFNQNVALVAAATGKTFGRNQPPRVSETSAVRILELSLMWALNNRTGQPSHDILPEDEGEAEEGVVLPVNPDETIEAADDQSEASEE